MYTSLTRAASTEAFLEAAGIPYAARASAEYVASCEDTFMCTSSFPSGIAQPRTAADVQAIVRHCIAEDVPFVVRSGGHDMFSRTTVQDVLTIDMRSLRHVDVGADKTTARIGGGILFDKLLADLEAHGLCTPAGSVSTVGWVGWATLGGYGHAAPWAGLGVDQILGATVVDARGELVEADERLLKGIRGGGGNFGVIVEVTIKVYPFQPIQSGSIFYDTADLTGTLTTFFANLAALRAATPPPPNLSITPTVFAFPASGAGGGPPPGPLFFCTVTWTGARTDACTAWIGRIAGLAPALTPGDAAVQPTTPLAAMRALTAQLPRRLWGRMQTLSLAAPDPPFVAALVPWVARVPLTGCGVVLHELRRGSPSATADAGSVFAGRQPHYVLEVLAGGATEAEGSHASLWACGLRDGLAGLAGVFGWSYPSLTAPEYADVDRMYGDQAAELRRLKAELDPKGVFRNSVPRM